MWGHLVPGSPPTYSLKKIVLALPVSLLLLPSPSKHPVFMSGLLGERAEITEKGGEDMKQTQSPAQWRAVFCLLSPLSLGWWSVL